MAHSVFIANTLRLLSWNYIKYKINWVSKLNCIKNIVSQLSKKNIMYIKIIQSLATNGALFDKEQMEYLEQYTDHVPYDENDVDTTFLNTIRTVSKKTDSTFILETPTIPFKAGMVALVHKGTLNNKPVVIKVIRNNIREKIIKALDEMESLFSVLSWVPQIKAMNIIAIMRENREAMIEQTNFTKELENLNEMKNLCTYTDYIKIPDVYSEYTDENPNIIVMEYLDGKRIEEVQPDEAPQYSKLLAQFEAKTTMFNTFYHADLHSGNILFMRDDDDKEMLGIIDFGIMGKSTKEQQEAFYNIFKCADIEKNRGYNTSIALLDGIAEPKDILNNLSPKQREHIINVVQPCVIAMLESSEGVTPEHLYKINKCLIKYNMHLANSFCKMHMAMLAMDSVSHRLNGRSSHLCEIRGAVRDIFDGLDNLLDI